MDFLVAESIITTDRGTRENAELRTQRALAADAEETSVLVLLLGFFA